MVLYRGYTVPMKTLQSLNSMMPKYGQFSRGDKLSASVGVRGSIGSDTVA